MRPTAGAMKTKHCGGQSKRGRTVRRIRHARGIWVQIDGGAKICARVCVELAQPWVRDVTERVLRRYVQFPRGDQGDRAPPPRGADPAWPT